MLVALIYSMTAAGVDAATGRFWLAVLWPYHLGKLIGSALSPSEHNNPKNKD